MGKLQSKRKRVYFSFEPETFVVNNFYQNHNSYLLPALLEKPKIRSFCEIDDEEVTRVVRLEVDMALVTSTPAARAMRRRLQSSSGARISLWVTKTFHLSFWVSPPITRTPITSLERMSLKRNGSNSKRIIQTRKRNRSGVTPGGDFGSRVQKLQSILPGREKMGLYELLSEVRSYVVCLELQVSLLRALVDRHC